MSATFDCIDHNLLLQRLQIDFGLSNAPLEWIHSFLSDRTYQLLYGGDLTHTYLLQYGVPQGSVLGPLLYVLYTADVCHVVERHGMHLHLCADDSQIYTSVAVSHTTSAVHCLAVCITDISNWMSASRLRFYPSKTEIMWLGAGNLL